MEPPTLPLHYGWTKFTSNYQNYIFPKYYEYANWELMVPLFSGTGIDFTHSVNFNHDIEQTTFEE